MSEPIAGKGRSGARRTGNAPAVSIAQGEPLVLHRAGSVWQRLCGLLGRPPLGPGQGLWLTPCRAVHTAGMRYAIDLAFIDRRGRVVRIVRSLRPWRWAACWRARSVVELAAGEADCARGGAARIEAAVRNLAAKHDPH